MKKGIAEEVIAKDLTSSALTDKIKLLLFEEKYKYNMIAASKAFRDQKETPLERGLWWIEWVLRNPDAVHFKSPANGLSFFEIQSVDVIAFLTIVLVALTYGTFLVLRKLLKLILCRKSRDNSKRKLE